MRFETMGERGNPAILFFHAMGVVGESSEPVVRFLRERYFCVLPTSSVYCPGQRYVSKEDEIRQVEDFLRAQGVRELALVVSSSLGADLAAVYLAIKSLWWTQGGTLKRILWCDDDAIKPYFIAAGQALRYGNLRRQLEDSLTDAPFPPLPEDLQMRCVFAFGSAEDHFKYRPAVMVAYPKGRFPVFEGYNHMQYQIQDPEGFAAALVSLMETDQLPELPILRREAP